MAYIRVAVDEDEILSEIDTDDLIEELKSRNDLPPKYKAVQEISYHDDRTPKRNAIISVLGLSINADLGEILQAVTINYDK